MHTVNLCKTKFDIFTFCHTLLMMSELSRKTISMEKKLYRAALERAEKLGYGSFSEYIQFLMEADVEEKPAHITKRTESGSTEYTTPDSISEMVAEQD